MSINVYRAVEAQSAEPCPNPDLRGLIKAHVVELLEDSAAEEVEDHLLHCFQCRETYLKMHYVLGAAPGPARADGRHSARTVGDSKVVSIADYRERRRGARA